MGQDFAIRQGKIQDIKHYNKDKESYLKIKRTG